METLADRSCDACFRNTPALTREEELEMCRQVPRWILRDDRLRRCFTFDDFEMAMRFVDRMAALAVEQGHHPVFTVDFDKVDVQIWTHKIGALSANDFILAAKIDRAAMALLL